MNGVSRARTHGRHCIHALKGRAARKVQGSSSHRKLWKTYCHRVAEDVQEELHRHIGSKVNACATKRLEAELGAMGATQGIMPDFSDESALLGYTLQHFGRVRLLGDLMTQTQPDWLERRMKELFSSTGGKGSYICNGSDGKVDNQLPHIDLVSLGGGPGYDWIAAATLSEYCSGPDVKAQIYDYEPNWESTVDLMESATHSVLGSFRHECKFGRCDITQQLSEVVNTRIAEAASLGGGEIYTCSYCINENAVALRNKDWPFFRDLFNAASDGSLFFITDTTHRLWPELANVAKDAGLRFATPRICSGKAGWQFIAFKDDGHPGDKYYSTAISIDLLERFKADNAAHLSKLERGRG